MATTLKQPTDRRGVGELRALLDRLSRRERIAALALVVLLGLLLAVGVGSAVGGGLPFGGEEEASGSSSLPAEWAGLDPLLPLAPSLKDVAALKGAAAGGASGVLAAESGGGRALRLRALPEGAGPVSLPRGVRVATAAERTPSGRRRAATRRAPAVLRVPSVRRILATRVRTVRALTNDLLTIVRNDLRNLSGLPLDLDLDLLRGIPIPPINGPVIDPPDLPGADPVLGANPLRGGGSIPRLPGGAPLNLTVVDSQADSRFDVLLVASGRRLVEAYRYADRDVAGLAAQINLRSSVLVADVLRDGRRLAQVNAAPLSFGDAADPAGTAAAGLGAVASPDGRESRADQPDLTSAGSGAKERATARARLDDRARRDGRARGDGRTRGGGSAGGGSSPTRSSLPRSFSGAGGAKAPRRAKTARSRPSLRTRARPPRRRSSPGAGHSGGKPSRKPHRAKRAKRSHRAGQSGGRGRGHAHGRDG